MSGYRIALALATLRDEIARAYPVRDTRSDGWIGDPAHRAHWESSDHNPWVVGPDGVGVVRAIDVDSSGGIGRTVAEKVRADGLAGHAAMGGGSYVIFERQIASSRQGWVWRSYSGSNPHTEHVHVSVGTAAEAYDSRARWGVFTPQAPASPGPRITVGATVRRGDTGADVRLLQRFLGVADDGDFGPLTEAAVRRYQQMRRLGVDGVVGPQTWGAILSVLRL